MSKLTDDKIDHAESRLPGIVPAEPRLRRVPGMVDDHARAIIVRAIVLRLAMTGDINRDDAELYGLALSHVCREWLQTRSDELREKR